MLRAFRILANTPLLPPPAAASSAVQMKAFSTTTPHPQAGTATRQDSRSDGNKDAQNEDNKPNGRSEQSAPQSSTTDEIAHSQGAYDGSRPDPKESAKEIEQEKGKGSLQTSAANPKASKPPKEASS